ncbi:hypothetical protein GCM10027184_37810 [Saccharothrix stipae]
MSTTLNADGTLRTVQPEARTGTAEESRRIAIRDHSFAVTTTDDLATAEETKKSLATAAAEAEPPADLLAQCLDSDLAGAPGGRVMFRHFWCQQNTVHGVYLYNGKEEGSFTLEYRAAAVANPFTRQVHYFFHGDDYEADGSFSGWSTLGLKLECVVLTAGCSVDREWVTMDVGDWDDGEWVNWNITSDENVATQQPEKVLRNIFTVTGTARDDFGRVVNLTSVTRPGIRCDSASYFPNEPKACVFTDVIPFLGYQYGRGYDEVVTHIKTAHEQPGSTHPAKAGKVVPGYYGGIPGSPGLNRVPYGGAIWTANGVAKDAACATLPPKQDGQQCDEFPFATTRQGAGLGDGNFSVKYVNGSQNGSAGGALTAYYRWDRILYDQNGPVDGILDEFWVRAG